MKKNLLPASLACLLTVLIAVPTLKAKSNKYIVKSSAVTTTSNEAATAENTSEKNNNTTVLEAASNLLYDSLKLERMVFPAM